MRYYLIARNRRTNELDVLNDNSDVINGEYGEDLRNKDVYRLEAIDLFTTSFRVRNDLTNYLRYVGVIDEGDYDYFIANLGRDKKIKIRNVIYNENDHKIRYIAHDSLANKLRNSDHNKLIFDKFFTKYFYNDDFNWLIDNGFSELGDSFKNIIDPSYSKPLYKLKYTDSWILDRYEYSRGIASSFIMCDKSGSKKNMLNNIKLFNTERFGVADKLRDLLDGNIIDGQFSLFDDKYLENVRSKEEVDNYNNKKKYTLDTLREIPSSFFTKSNGKMIIDSSKISDKIILDDRKTLLYGLSEAMIDKCYHFNFSREKLDEVRSYHMNTLELEDDVNYYNLKLKSLLKDEKKLDRAYTFARVYNKHMKDSKVYEKKRS